jgi:hypothetical protein
MGDKTSVELKEIRNALILSRGETCRANNLLGFRKCVDCPFDITDSSGKHMCFEADLELQFITTSEIVNLKDGWEVTIKRVGLLQ